MRMVEYYNNLPNNATTGRAMHNRKRWQAWHNTSKRWTSTATALLTDLETQLFLPPSSAENFITPLLALRLTVDPPPTINHSINFRIGEWNGRTVCRDVKGLNIAWDGKPPVISADPLTMPTRSIPSAFAGYCQSSTAHNNPRTLMAIWCNPSGAFSYRQT